MASTDALFAAIEAGDAEAVAAIVTEDPSLARARDAEGVSALMRSRYRFDRALVAAVMTAHPELDVFEAAALGDLDRLAALLDADPSLATTYSTDGFSPLHLSAFFGQSDATRLLLERGAEVDARGRGWMTGTPLHSAASGDHAAVALVLVEAGADTNARQSGGWTPLHSAAHNGNAELVALFLAHGADPTATNDEGTSVLAMAEEAADDDSIARIREAIGA
jgi:ankyrin repeat protein